MSPRDRTEFRRRAWLAVKAADKDGERCADCEWCWRSGPAADEPATRECGVLYLGDEPTDCPAVDVEAIRDEMDAAAEEAADARRDWWRNFDARR